MSRYTMELIMKKWVEPSIDTSKWEFYDLSCKAPPCIGLIRAACGCAFFRETYVTRYMQPGVHDSARLQQKRLPPYKESIQLPCEIIQLIGQVIIIIKCGHRDRGTDHPRPTV